MQQLRSTGPPPLNGQTRALAFNYLYLHTPTAFARFIIIFVSYMHVILFAGG